jgi:hypothetical protein
MAENESNHERLTIEKTRPSTLRVLERGTPQGLKPSTYFNALRHD